MFDGRVASADPGTPRSVLDLPSSVDLLPSWQHTSTFSNSHSDFKNVKTRYSDALAGPVVHRQIFLQVLKKFTYLLTYVLAYLLPVLSGTQGGEQSTPSTQK